MNPFHRLFASFLEQDREQDLQRHAAIASLRADFIGSATDAPDDVWETLVPIVEGWVRANLSVDATATFDDVATDVRVLTNGNFGVAGPVDVSVGGRRAARSWFIAEARNDGQIVFAEIVDVDPQVN